MILTKLNKIYNQWRDNKTHRRTSNKIKETKDWFKVEEKDGRVYLMCDGVAFASLGKHVSISELTENLKVARQAAIDYRIGIIQSDERD